MKHYVPSLEKSRRTVISVAVLLSFTGTSEASSIVISDSRSIFVRSVVNDFTDIDGDGTSETLDAREDDSYLRAVPGPWLIAETSFATNPGGTASSGATQTSATGPLAFYFHATSWAETTGSEYASAYAISDYYVGFQLDQSYAYSYNANIAGGGSGHGHHFGHAFLSEGWNGPAFADTVVSIQATSAATSGTLLPGTYYLHASHQSGAGSDFAHAAPSSFSGSLALDLTLTPLATAVSEPGEPVALMLVVILASAWRRPGHA